MKSLRKKASPQRVKNRASISFPPEIYNELEKLAAAKKVSLAWIVREATEKYLADQWPLLAERQ
jgi:predicted DNA-binding protein